MHVKRTMQVHCPPGQRQLFFDMITTSVRKPSPGLLILAGGTGRREDVNARPTDTGRQLDGARPADLGFAAVWCI